MEVCGGAGISVLDRGCLSGFTPRGTQERTELSVAFSDLLASLSRTQSSSPSIVIILPAPPWSSSLPPAVILPIPRCHPPNPPAVILPIPPWSYSPSPHGPPPHPPWSSSPSPRSHPPHPPAVILPVPPRSSSPSPTVILLIPLQSSSQHPWSSPPSQLSSSPSPAALQGLRVHGEWGLKGPFPQHLCLTMSLNQSLGA
ncbi:hypothetical protein P7K49_026072 [Saguinus oedipus]|uniref:Uncharacterized protein n=1 Tax=Saguinus oedipus TaxID=9490 RepID=A0ABQ9UIY4_SAGOE|nr:hypothetical protein P7K49_026072 [Saguinus oedipus]